MQAEVGDRLHIHGHNVGDPDKMGEIVEVHGKAGQPPYLVRFDDGHTGLVFPGPDAVIEHPSRAPRGGKAATSGAGRAASARGRAASSGAARSRSSGSPARSGRAAGKGSR